MRTITIPKDFFKDLEFDIQLSPFGEKKCCCGHTNCIDLDCFYFSTAQELYAEVK